MSERNEEGGGKWRYWVHVRTTLLVAGAILLGVASHVARKYSVIVVGMRRALFSTQFMNASYILLGFVTLLPYQYWLAKDKAFPPWKEQFWYALIGVVDAFGILLQGISAGITPGPWMAVIGQLALPVAFIVGLAIPRTRKAIFGGWKTTALLIPFSVAIVLMIASTVVITLPAFEESGHAQQGLGLELAVPVLAYILGACVRGFVLVFKEWRLVQETGNVFHLSAWVSIYIFIMTFCVSFVQCIPYLGNLTPKEIPLELLSGARMMIPSANNAWDAAGYIWAVMLGYSATIFVSGTVHIALARNSSAAAVYAAGIITLLMVALVYGIKPLVGPRMYREITIYELLALVPAICGGTLFSVCRILLRRWAKKREPEKDESAISDESLLSYQDRGVGSVQSKHGVQEVSGSL